MSFYKPNAVPADPKDLPGFLRAELERIALASQNTNQYYLLDKLYAVPLKTKDGMIVYADGTTWNPGSGAGAYIYRGAAWHFLG